MKRSRMLSKITTTNFSNLNTNSLRIIVDVIEPKEMLLRQVLEKINSGVSINTLQQLNRVLSPERLPELPEDLKVDDLVVYHNDIDENFCPYLVKVKAISMKNGKTRIHVENEFGTVAIFDRATGNCLFPENQMSWITAREEEVIYVHE